MRIVRYFFPAFVLAITLAVSTSAGVMSTPDDPPPPAQTTADGGTTTSDGGDIHTGNSDGATASDAVVAGALSLLQGVLSLL